MIIIPARYASTRFPGKMLADVNGLAMIVRCAKNMESVDSVCVACDDERILTVCESHNIHAVLTSTAHKSGTDRIYEAAISLGLQKDEFIINVQGDEPFLESDVVKKLQQTLHEERGDFIMASCYKMVSKQDASDANLVKVVTNHDDYALYFSRSPIPFDREGGFSSYKGHIGIYGFTVGSLQTFCSLTQSTLEDTEKLEQLRALEAGLPIKMIRVETRSFGIDTPRDLQNALAIFKENR